MATLKQVWSEYFDDETNHVCYSGCGNEITPTTFHFGYLIHPSTGGSNNINNIRPICNSCRKRLAIGNGQNLPYLILKQQIKCPYPDKDLELVLSMCGLPKRGRRSFC